MNILLDTHIVLWWLDGRKKLPKAIIRKIETAPTVYVSAASAWEVAIKSSLGRLHIPAPFEEGVEQSAFTQLPISFAHAAAVSSLPQHHGDPFDRILVAQSIVENLAIITHDSAFKLYGQPVIWV